MALLLLFAFLPADAELNLNDVKYDIATMLTHSQEFWPADFGNYGPFMIRQAWHCAGTYRTFDGRGGCDGGRQRFDPERSWEDNTNLDKSKTLLWPIKAKYPEMSWGDLIILAGNVAIETMGGPLLGFCGGRQDDADGSQSVNLGPTPEQEANFPCEEQGNCKAPLGATTVGLIYVNPEGPQADPDQLELSAQQIRDTFARMNMDDNETVALIGGGHAFGKAHGACPAGAGPSPKEDPTNPWPGNCGTGRGADTFTSGFEGPWTLNPTSWGNSYFTLLRDNAEHWEKHRGPGGHWQWRSNMTPGIMMLTSDIALLHDPEGSYQVLVEHYASSPAALDDAFSRAWYKLTTRDMGPHSRCTGNDVPAPQPFQYPLPPPPDNVAGLEEIRAAISTAMRTVNPALPPDEDRGAAYYGSAFVQLAWLCSSTFRQTDYLGGCNGARIRHVPQSEWPVNVGTHAILEVLRPVKEQYGEALSWADLIIAAAHIAIEESTGQRLSFCPGRTDAVDGAGSMELQPNLNGSSDIRRLKLSAQTIGLSDRELVALSGRLRSPVLQAMRGFEGSWSTQSAMLSNQYFSTLLEETWVQYEVPGTGVQQYKAVGKELYMMPEDMAVRWDSHYLAIAQEYAGNNTLFLEEFASAWTKLVTVDRFDGPTATVCPPPPPSPSPAPAPDGPTDDGGSSFSAGVAALLAIAGTATVAFGAFFVYLKMSPRSRKGDSVPLLKK